VPSAGRPTYHEEQHLRTLTALVTGSTGFVGRHVVTRLKELGYDVDPWDITQGNDCLRLFADRSDTRRFDLVVHAAAAGPNRLAIDDEPEHFPYNIQLDSAMFNWARRTEPRHVVYLSSSAAYPALMQDRAAVNSKLRPLEEDDVKLAYLARPADSYGWTKLMGELFAGTRISSGTTVSVLRPFSGYGEDQGEEFPFGAIVERVRRQEDPVTFLGNGQQVRDWIHIDDVVAVLTKTIGLNTTVNVCTGIGTTIRALAYTAAQIAGYKPTLQPASESWGGAHAGVDYRVGNPTKMLKYHHPRVNLAQGIARRLEVS
jgi:nucleoside-diphosphate-sugar epimerase